MIEHSPKDLLSVYKGGPFSALSMGMQFKKRKNVDPRRTRRARREEIKKRGQWAEGRRSSGRFFPHSAFGPPPSSCFFVPFVDQFPFTALGGSIYFALAVAP
jgi:hypothetical protein